MSDPQRPVARPLPTDPDIDLSVAAQRRELSGHHPTVLGVIALGGIIGTLARYQIGSWWPTATDHFPAATLTINLTGCLVIGIFMVVITEVLLPHPLLRPFFGTGVLGGFTTFSTYAIDIQGLLRHGQVGTALTYLTSTAVGAIAAVGAGMFLARRFTGRGRA